METIDKKSYIESVAFQLFLNVGYDATSIRMICKKSEIEPPTLYKYFGSKKGLFFLIAQELIVQFFEKSKVYNALLRSLPLEIQLYSIYSASITYTVEHIDETKFFFRYSHFCPLELQVNVQKCLADLQEAKKQVVNAILIEYEQKKLIGIDADRAFSYFQEFLDNISFNVVFKNWRPSKEEMLELWEAFFRYRLKGFIK